MKNSSLSENKRVKSSAMKKSNGSSTSNNKNEKKNTKDINKEPSKDLIIHDLHITPPGIDMSDKYYIGFFDGERHIAVMDIIDGYPEGDMAFIGFFMVDAAYQGRQIGSGIIQDTCAYLKQIGKTVISLSIDKGNPQSTHFWKKNGFIVIKEVEQNGGTLLVADKKL